MDSNRGAQNGTKRTNRDKQKDVTPSPQYPVAFVDSSAIVALVDADDISHGAAVEAYQSLVSSGYRLFTTNHVILEAYSLLMAGVGPDVARQWLRDNRLAVYTANEDDESSARDMVI